MALKTVEEIIEYLNEMKNVSKALADEYRTRYNENKDANDHICRTLYYHYVIDYNAYEEVLAEIECRQKIALCFSHPPIIEIGDIADEFRREIEEAKNGNQN